jgi:metal-responsive CopG/Arc/MetJ family transcriptional regulator
MILVQPAACAGVSDRAPFSRLSRTNRSLSVFEATTNASLSTSLTERDCLEIVVVQGETGRIRELLEALRARKGVRQAKLTVVSP